MKLTIREMGVILTGTEKRLHANITHEVIRKETEKNLGVVISPENYKRAYICGKKYQNRFNT